jgi:predicted acylesterase/phospholipase RssA
VTLQIGYVDNLPVDVMRDFLQPRFVIAVDVENKEEEYLRNVTMYGDYMSGWWLWRQRIWNHIPWVKRTRIPKFAELISSLMYVIHNTTQSYHFVGLFIADF